MKTGSILDGPAMKRITTVLGVAALLLRPAPAVAVAVAGQSLTVTIVPQWGGASFKFDSLSYRIATRTPGPTTTLSVSRLDFLLSNIALRRTGGGWLGLTNWFAYLSPREGRDAFEVKYVPAAGYDRLRFQIGVPAAVNHADPARLDPGHPLNPNVNGLHWSWQGGYVFFALEGSWRPPGIPPAAGIADPSQPEYHLGGFSYHLATDPMLMTVELPVALDLTEPKEVRLGLDLELIFSGAHQIPLDGDTASTHSRDGDPLARPLRENVETAFSVQAIRPATPRPAGAGSTGPVEIAPHATPYPFTLSRFFPRPSLPSDNPLTEEGVALGRLLFLDPRLSVNGSQSCASCHDSSGAFTDHRAVSLGAEGQPGTRRAMPLFNLAWKSSFFWDGRAPTLREQVLQPIENPVEMHETLTNVVAKLRRASVDARHQERALEWARRQATPAERRNVRTRATDDPVAYTSLFLNAFGTEEITADRIARALEQCLLVQVSGDAKIDRVLRNEEAFTEEEQRGFQLFHTEYDPRRRQFGADCFHCHGGPLFRSQSFANNGLDAEPRDPGRFAVTRQRGDFGKFAVPSLRNVALTAPYMHDGRFNSLPEVIQHYSTGVKRSRTLDPNLAKHPHGGIRLSQEDQQALVAFLQTLTDTRLRVP